MELTVYNNEGNKTSKTVKLDAEVFGIEPNDHAIYLDVKSYLAAQRQGTHKSKERNEISGSTRKIKRQKGTGGARAGSIKNPLFRGGGTVFGPRPHAYDLKVNKKVKRLARRSALSYKAQGNGIMLLDALQMDSAKTSSYVKLLKNLSMDTSKTLVVLPSHDQKVYLSARNLKKHTVRVASDLNTYDIMNCKNLIFVNNAHEIVQEMLKK
jgi:large subunit ribosomal protein L4